MYRETSSMFPKEAGAVPFDWNSSIPPMNVRPSSWRGLRNPQTGAPYTRKELKKPYNNITAGALILKRISGQLQRPSVTKIATLYNDLSATKVSQYGVRVNQYYHDHPWKKPIDRRSPVNDPYGPAPIGP